MLRTEKIQLYRVCGACRKLFVRNSKKVGSVLCRSCFYKKYNKPYYEKNGEHIKQRIRRNYKANTEKHYQKWKSWVEENKDRRRAIALRSYHRNKLLKGATKTSIEGGEQEHPTP